jgi:hypothetical protein
MEKKKEINKTHFVCLLRILQRVDIVNPNLQLARFKKTEELVDVVLKLLSCLNVSKERGAADLDTLGRDTSR